MDGGQRDSLRGMHPQGLPQGTFAKRETFLRGVRGQRDAPLGADRASTRSESDSSKIVFSSGQVANFTGASLRQLQWWDERGIIKARLEGHCRVWSAETVLRVKLLTELRARRFSLSICKKLLWGLREPLNDGLVQKFVVTDGRTIQATTSQDDAFRWCMSAGRCVAVIGINPRSLPRS